MNLVLKKLFRSLLASTTAVILVSWLTTTAAAQPETEGAEAAPQESKPESEVVEPKPEFKEVREDAIQEIPDVKAQVQSLIRDFQVRNEDESVSLEEALEALQQLNANTNTASPDEASVTDDQGEAARILADQTENIEATIESIPAVKQQAQKLITDFEPRESEPTEHSETTDSTD